MVSVPSFSIMAEEAVTLLPLPSSVMICRVNVPLLVNMAPDAKLPLRVMVAVPLPYSEAVVSVTSR